MLPERVTSFAAAPRRRPGRALAVVAAGFLGLDSILLALAGVWSHRWALFAWALVFGAGTVGIVVLWRRYLRHLVELDDARTALKQEVTTLGAATRNRRG